MWSVSSTSAEAFSAEPSTEVVREVLLPDVPKVDAVFAGVLPQPASRSRERRQVASFKGLFLLIILFIIKTPLIFFCADVNRAYDSVPIRVLQSSVLYELPNPEFLVQKPRDLLAVDSAGVAFMG